MRIAQILGTLGGAAVAFSASSLAAAPSSIELLPSAPPVTSPTSSYHGVGSTSVPHAPGSANVTISPFTTAAVIPTTTNLVNATTSHTAGVTGGAIPQQMQASMAGLLGFCIMGLVML